MFFRNFFKGKGMFPNDETRRSLELVRELQRGPLTSFKTIQRVTSIRDSLQQKKLKFKKF